MTIGQFKNEVVGAAALGSLFGCSPRTIRQLARRGVVVETLPGRYAVEESTTRYVRELRALAGNQPITPDAVQANARLREARTALVELRVRRERGEFVPVEAVRAAWSPIIRGVRQFVLGLPGAISFAIPTLTVPDKAVIERICREALEDAALGRGFDVEIDRETQPGN